MFNFFWKKKKAPFQPDTQTTQDEQCSQDNVELHTPSSGTAEEQAQASSAKTSVDNIVLPLTETTLLDTKSLVVDTPKNEVLPLDEPEEQHTVDTPEQGILPPQEQQELLQQTDLLTAQDVEPQRQPLEAQEIQASHSNSLEPDSQPIEPLVPTEKAQAQNEETLPTNPAQAEAQHDNEVQNAEPAAPEVERSGWFKRLTKGLKKTGRSITQVFTNAKIDDELYDELEAALLMADGGSKATQYLLEQVKIRVKQTHATDAASVRQLLGDALSELLQPLEATLDIGEHKPTVIMVAGVNGAGKTTSIGKLTKHLAGAGCKTLLAAADTFRAAAREQLEVWADRNMVEIISQQGGDPASVAFDAVNAGRAREADVILIDTAGRLATQLHLMDELKKVRRVTAKAMEGAPHEVILVVDGNTGQNALTQVKAFDEAIDLTGLVVTKLDGTAKGGIIAAIALWSQERQAAGKAAVPVYFIGVGEQLEDLQTFNAREFAKALLEA